MATAPSGWIDVVEDDIEWDPEGPVLVPDAPAPAPEAPRILRGAKGDPGPEGPQGPPGPTSPFVELEIDGVVVRFPALPQLAIDVGAVVPNLGDARALAWSTAVPGLVVWDGVSWQAASLGGEPELPAGTLINKLGHALVNKLGEVVVRG